jgi:hypothetical protein
MLTHTTPEERRLLESLDHPLKIQSFLNTVAYSEDHFYRCPRRVLAERKAHCFDGALFAAMALRRLGFPPLILELIPNEHDDDHLLAIFKAHSAFGAIAQSNFSGLRYRDPVFRSPRELVMSYFNDFFNTAGERTLAGYRGPISLKVFDHLYWMDRDDGLDDLAGALDAYRVRSILTREMARDLSGVDARGLQAGLLGSNPAGLYQPNNG